MNDAVVAGFGDEWTRFDQSGLTPEDIQQTWSSHFAGFPWDKVGGDGIGLDLGRGSGRWAMLVAPRVGILHCIDASVAALDLAKRQLPHASNVTFTNAGVGALRFGSDRLGTHLEQRFSREQVRSMMDGAGLGDIVFSDASGYWVACGLKREAA